MNLYWIWSLYPQQSRCIIRNQILGGEGHVLKILGCGAVSEFKIKWWVEQIVNMVVGTNTS